VAQTGLEKFTNSLQGATILNPLSLHEHLYFMPHILNVTCHPHKSGPRTFFHDPVTSGCSSSVVVRARTDALMTMDPAPGT
jgi:hypothetical protein